MSHSLARRLQYGILISILTGIQPACAHGEPIAAHVLQGTLHGYLSIRDQTGHELAVGDLIQTVRGDRVTAHLIFHFKDGSRDDETSVFTQRGTFQLISDHHVQEGAFFDHPIDVLIEARKGQVTVRTPNKKGDEAKIVHMALPPDLYSGLMITTIAMNLSPNTANAHVSMLVATPKPRLVKLAFSFRGEDKFSLAGFERRALDFEIKFELQGIAGVIAPMIGKQPPNLEVWIQGGEVPAFVKEVGPLSEGGPIISLQTACPVGPSEPNAASTK